ncbi:hypothetical protein ACFLTI_00305 [Bacteroidota bacterium]
MRSFCYYSGVAQVKGIDLEKVQSKSHYFDWINSQYEGTTENQTVINMDFFQWLNDEYGMVLDVYSLDVGNIDDGPYTAGVGRLIPYHYGTMQTEEFKSQFPNGFKPLVDKAAGFGGRLAVWMGPDGFGTTAEEEKARKDMLISFCRDYNFIAFKVDAVAGQLRPEKQDVFKETINTCRIYTPDLIIQDHRVNFGTAKSVVTTSLWEGVETYIDVFMPNDRTGTHHRIGALGREVPPGLTRRLEDHGVCLSSCLDFWEDDLVLQAFNRSLLLSPSIYGNPWFLRDGEFPKLARIFNLHKRFEDVLVEAIELPENQYGPHSVSRGNSTERFISLRNLSWNKKKYTINLDESIGLEKKKNISVRQFFPTERIIGQLKWGNSLEVEVLPFRTCLILVSTKNIDEPGLLGCDYEIVRDTPGKAVIIKLLGQPGSRYKIKIPEDYLNYSKAQIDGVEKNELIRGREIQVNFPGESLTKDWHRKIGSLKQCALPSDSEALYEASCFAADNNALEVRAIQRSGESNIPQVIAARNVFFNKKMFVNRGIWDKNLFDAKMQTFFIARLDNRALRIDFGEIIFMDKLMIRIRNREEFDLNPALHSFDENTELQVSADLKNWTTLKLGYAGKGTIAQLNVPSDSGIRYVRIHGAPQRIAEVEAYLNGQKLNRSKWRASNLFHSYIDKPAISAWSMFYYPEEIPKNSYLAVALNGKHGNEGAYVSLRVNGKYIGAVDRSVSFPSNTWEYFNVESDSDYTYYFPLKPEMIGKKIEIVCLILKDGINEIKPEAWITAYPIPYESRELILYKE